MLRFFGLLFLHFLFLPIHSSYAQTLNCIEELKRSDSPKASAMIQCMDDMMKEEPKVTAEVIPRGAILAFDRDDLRQDKCPSGWSPYLAGRGRVIMGAGNPNVPENDLFFGRASRELTARKYRAHGGEETQKITTRELPSHSHEFKGNSFLRGQWEGEPKVPLSIGGEGAKLSADGNGHEPFVPSGENAKTGDGLEFSIMQPFIALYFCKKDQVE